MSRAWLQFREVVCVRHSGRCFASILCLFAWGCPTAVFRRIWPIVIYAIKCIPARRAGPHICVKVIEGEPLRTDCDSSGTIRRVLVIVWVQTPLLHTAPRIVLRPFAQSMRDVAWAGDKRLDSSASAICCVACPQVAYVNRVFVAANANTAIKPLALLAVRKLQHGEVGVVIANFVAWVWSFGHGRQYNTFTKGEYA